MRHGGEHVFFFPNNKSVHTYYFLDMTEGLYSFLNVIKKRRKKEITLVVQCH